MSQPTGTENVPVAGVCGKQFSAIKDAFRENLASGADVGASFAVTRGGETIIDLWGGFIDEARTRPWQKDTIVNVYSTTKTISALCLHVLADRGAVDLSAPVARYWPEFAQNGKEGVEVRHILSHSAGLPGLEEKTETEDYYDWEKITDRLARQKPWWEPGDEERLSRDYARVPDRRSRPPGDGQNDRGLSGRGDRRAVENRFSYRHRPGA